MRNVILTGGALALALTLGSCGAAANVAPAPSAPPPATASVGPSSSSALPAESEAPDPQPEPSLELAPTTALTPVPQPSPEGGPWAEVGAAVTTPEEAREHAQLPASFQDFLAVRLGYADETGCVTTRVDVRAVHPDGFVFGDEETTCGDSLTIWGIAERRWQYIVAFQDAIPCRDLAQNDVPAGVPGLRCLDDTGRAADY